MVSLIQGNRLLKPIKQTLLNNEKVESDEFSQWMSRVNLKIQNIVIHGAK